MNSETTEAVVQRSKRTVLMRLLFGILWILPIRFTINFLIGLVVGFSVGFSAGLHGGGSQEAARSLGETAASSFFATYGWFVLVGEIMLTALLGCLGVLPGTGKFKRMV